jgi:membrane-bound lytic murein transglycosylase D
MKLFAMAESIIRNIVLTCLIIMVWTASDAWSQPDHELEPSQFPSLMTSIRTNGSLDFCGEPVDLEEQEIRERLEKELLLTLWDRPQVILWIKRSARYLPLIESLLKEQHLPDDLKYIAIAESALRPHVGSPKKAIGFWQFMAATGRKYDLKIDAEKDERRNIFKSTQAAIMYFKDLYDLFESWTLAAAAYNMGEEGLQAEILAQKTNNYYRLYLPLETQRYVFRVISAKIILENPEKYGFQFKQEDFYPPLRFERITIECFQEIPILIVAQAADTHFKRIKDLNPEIRGHFLAVGTHTILIPEGSARSFHDRFKALVDQWLAERKERTYVVKEGDNLTTIAERFNVPLPVLLIWNRLGRKKYIHPGDQLVIYSPEIKTETDVQE